METAEAIALHDQLLANQPSGARHDADICPICVDKATETANPPSRIPPGSAGPDVSETQQKSQTNTEGGTPNLMSDNASSSISQETHQALVKHAVEEATASTDKALQDVTAEKADLAKRAETAEQEVERLKTDNDRLNGELDKAQVELKTAQDKAAELEGELTKERDDRSKAEIASKRADQVKNLNLFGDEYVSEKASSWAEMSDEAWAERVDEWAKLKPADSTGGAPNSDAASAMSGTDESLTKSGAESGSDAASENQPKPRRAVLGLS